MVQEYSQAGSEECAGSGFPSLNVGAVGIGGTQYTPQFDHSSSALHASLHDAYLNAQKLNRSSSSKNLRILRQTKKVPLRASNVCNKYLTNESLEAAFSFFFFIAAKTYCSSTIKQK